jgi:hypothetical protein
MHRTKDANALPKISPAFVLCPNHSASLLDERRCLHPQFRASFYESTVLTYKPFHNLALEATEPTLVPSRQGKYRQAKEMLR